MSAVTVPNFSKATLYDKKFLRKVPEKTDKTPFALPKF